MPDLGSTEMTMLWASLLLGFAYLLAADVANVAKRGRGWAFGSRDQAAADAGPLAGRPGRGHRHGSRPYAGRRARRARRPVRRDEQLLLAVRRGLLQRRLARREGELSGKFSVSRLRNRRLKSGFTLSNCFEGRIVLSGELSGR